MISRKNLLKNIINNNKLHKLKKILNFSTNESIRCACATILGNMDVLSTRSATAARGKFSI